MTLLARATVTAEAGTGVIYVRVQSEMEAKLCLSKTDLDSSQEAESAEG